MNSSTSSVVFPRIARTKGRSSVGYGVFVSGRYTPYCVAHWLGWVSVEPIPTIPSAAGLNMTKRPSRSATMTPSVMLLSTDSRIVI